MVIRVHEQRHVVMPARGGDAVDAVDDLGRLEQHRRHEHGARRVVDRLHEPLCQRVGGAHGHACHDHAFFRQPIELTPNRVELTVGGDERCRRAAADPNIGTIADSQPHDQIVRVRPQRDVAVVIVQQPAKSAAHVVGDGLRFLPLGIDQLRRIEPRLLLRLEGDIRPRLMRMAGEEQTLADLESRVVNREIRGRDPLRTQKAPGPDGTPGIDDRSQARADRPEIREERRADRRTQVGRAGTIRRYPILTPIVRSTILTWR